MSGIGMVFSGQGTQYVGMGKSLYENFPQVEKLFTDASAIIGLPLSELCFNGPLAELTITANLQPAITVVNLACFMVLQEKGVKPAAVAGHSLGEISALVACGCWSVEQALNFVKLRGLIMDREASLNPGVMKMVMGPSNERVQQVCVQVDGVVQLANMNTPNQSTLTGAADAVEAAAAILKQEKARIIPLKVSGPWHSCFMQKAEDELKAVIEGMDFAAPNCYMLPNVSGKPSKDPQFIKQELMRQIVSPTNWVETARGMWGLGLNTFLQVGPKNALVGMIKQTIEETYDNAQVKTGNVEDMESLEKTMALLAG